MPHNIPEERTPQLHHGGNQKSFMFSFHNQNNISTGSQDSLKLAQNFRTMFRVMHDSKTSHLASFQQFEVNLPREQKGLTLSLYLLSRLILSHSRGNEALF